MGAWGEEGEGEEGGEAAAGGGGGGAVQLVCSMLKKIDGSYRNMQRNLQDGGVSGRGVHSAGRRSPV